MASAWAQLSKEEQAAFSEKGYTKASYNDQYGKGGEPAPGSNSSPQELIDTWTPNAAAASQQEAVERSQSWEDLSKKDKKAEKADGETKKSFNQSTGYRAEEIAIQKQDADPENTKYSEMSDTYKENTDKSDHKQSRKDAGTYTNDRLDSYNVDSLDDFDISNTGRGRKEGQYRLSVDELNKLNASGFSKEEIANRAMTGEWSDAKKGTKAQELLDSWMAEFTSDPVDPGPGDPGPGDPGPGDPGPGDPGDPTDPVDPVDPVDPTDPVDPVDPTDPVDPVDPTDPVDPIDKSIDQENNQEIVNEDIQNTNIEDSFNGGTIGDITQGGTINGNNNTINNTVDNSNNSRYYGGSNTVWNINNSNGNTRCTGSCLQVVGQLHRWRHITNE